MRCIDCNVVLKTSGDNANRYLDTDRCIECALLYRYCPHCGTFMLMTNMRGQQCPKCFRENPTLATYNTRVDVTHREKGKRLFGVELETEAKNEQGVKDNIIHIDDYLGDNVLMKRDGSLQNGIEIVTKPFSLEKHYLLWSKFLSAKHPGLVSWDSSRCGMHVHVGREGLTEQTIAKAVCFINSYGNKKFMYVIAGRKDNNYAKFKQKTMDEAIRFQGERHEAVNVGNPDTVEFRLFKGTLKKESVYKNIEFCDAILDYANHEDDLSRAMSRQMFVKFVKTQNKWPHLMAFIMARWFGKANELSEQAGWKTTKNCSCTAETNLIFEE